MPPIGTTDSAAAWKHQRTSFWRVVLKEIHEKDELTESELGVKSSMALPSRAFVRELVAESLDGIGEMVSAEPAALFGCALIPPSSHLLGAMLYDVLLNLGGGDQEDLHTDAELAAFFRATRDVDLVALWHFAHWMHDRVWVTENRDVQMEVLRRGLQWRCLEFMDAIWQGRADMPKDMTLLLNSEESTREWLEAKTSVRALLDHVNSVIYRHLEDDWYREQRIRTLFDLPMSDLHPFPNIMMYL